MKADRILVALLLAGPAAAADYGALEPLAFLAGHCWRGEVAEGAATDTHCFSWVYGGKHLRDVHVVQGERSDYRGETIYSVDGATGDVVYRYWNSNGGTSEGRLEFPAANTIVAPGERYTGEDGNLREFGTVIERLDEITYRTRTRERVGDEWRELASVVFRRVGGDTPEGPAARQQTEKLAVFAPYVGEWLPHPDDPALAARPEMRGKTAFGLAWGPRRMYVTVREVYPSGEPEEAIAQGLVYRREISDDDTSPECQSRSR